MDEEDQALQSRDTWTLISRPDDSPVVGCRWVFAVKYRANGSIDRYKVQLIAKGFTQTFGVDYAETFSSVARLNFIRVLLSLFIN